MQNEQLTTPSRPGSRRSALAAWAPRLILLLILLVGGYFRTLSLTDWDSDTGQHPDERFFSTVATTVRLPASLAEFYDSTRSPLNPRNYDQTGFYVYGPFPIYLTRAVAVALTPNDDANGPILPELDRSIAGIPRTGVDPERPDERRTDFGEARANPERSFPKLSPLIPLFNPEGRNLTVYGEIQKVGRGLAVLFDLGSIVLAYLIGRRLFGVRVGLVAAALLALTAMAIQQSHFFVDPIFSTFFCMLSLYWAVRVAQGDGWLAYSLLGLSIGAAMANRITMATFGLIAIVAAGVAAVRFVQQATERRSRFAADGDGWRADPPAYSRYGFGLSLDRFVGHELPLLVLAGALTLLSFRTLAPDAFLGSQPDSQVLTTTAAGLQGGSFFDIRPEPRFVNDLSQVQRLVSGEADFPPSQQWVGRTPWLFPWTNMVLWGMGPALGIAAWAALIAFGLLGLRRLLWPQTHLQPLSPAWVPFVWVAFYFAWQGQQFAITLRYLLPIYGALIVFAAWGVCALWSWAQSSPAAVVTAKRAKGAKAAAGSTAKSAKAGRLVALARPLALAALPLVLIGTFGWAYAFSRIYTQPHSRVIAAQWFAENARPGSYVIAEIWDDPLPLQVTAASWGSTFDGIQSAPYAEDEPQKYFGGPDGSGGRNEGLLDQLDRADYITLTSNRVYDSTSRLRMRYPALMRYYHHLFSGELGFRLAAEITSYPRILGIEIPDQAAEEAFHVYDHPRVLIFEKTPSYSRERAEQLLTDDVLWNEVYKSPVNIADRNPSALRLTDGQWPRYTLGGTWSERFSSTALSTTLAPLSWLFVIQLLGLAMFGLLFPLLPRLPDRGYSLAKILGLLAVAYLAWLLGSLGNNPGIPGRGNVGGVGFGLLPLPFTSATLWLCTLPLLAAGGYGWWRSRHQLAAFWRERRAALLSAEGIFLGFLALGLLLRWLNPDLWHPARGGEKPMDLAYLTAVLKSSAFPPYDPWHAGGYINYYYFGFVLVGALVQLTAVPPSIAYNLAVATIFALTALGAWGLIYNLLASQRRAGGGERRALIAAGLAPVLLLLLGNLAQAFWFISGYAAQQGAQGRLEWAYWDATRLVQGAVNEFPFFTFLFGDLHAHMIVMPLSLALLGLALAYAVSLLENPVGSSRFLVLRTLGFVLALGLVAGAIRVTNTWDYPPFVGLAGATMVLAGWRVSRGRRSFVWTAIWALLPPLLMVLVGNGLFTLFTRNFATESSGAELWREGLAPTLVEQILLAQRTSIWDAIRLSGHWLFVAAAAGLLLIGRVAGARLAGAAAGALALVTLVGALLGWPAILLLLPLLAVALWLAWGLRRAPLHLLLPALWLAGAIGLLAMVELVVVRGDIGRMNTVFKFGLHSWMLFALAAAALLPGMWAWAARQRGAMAVPGYLLRGGLVILALAALVYPLTATPARAADRWVAEAPRTLDGNAYMAFVTAERNGQPFSLNEDAAAIDWLQRNVRGTPVILEAHLPSYQWAGRVATNTGLPTLLGWEWHQVQQRNAVGAGPTIAARQQTIGEIYNTPDPATALEWLRGYGVQFVYVGGVERATYDQTGLAKFEAMAQQGQLERVFQQGQTAIYRVAEPGTPRMLTSDLPIVAPTADTWPPLLLEQPVGALPVVNEYSWNSAVAGNSWLSSLLWLLAIYGIGVLGLPLAWTVFGRWRDGGASWAKLIGLLLLGLAVWLPTSLGLWQYDRWGLLGGLALVIMLNVALLAWLGNGSARAGLDGLVSGLRARRRTVAAGEALFLLAFAGLALIRALNPDLWHPVWGGEKPMEFGFLNAILRSPVMPPYDPFFSGGYINYYYYGFYLVSLPIKLTGIAPAIGFNLGVATIFALTVAGAFTVVAQLTGRVRYGLLASLLVTVLGNLAAYFPVGWSRGFPAVLEALRNGGLNGLGARLGDWYIGPTRVIPNTINEFPAFTFLFADLHPHMIALPLALLAVALGWQLLGPQLRHDERGYGIAWFGLAALTLGGLAVTNSWDFPTYGLLTGLALLGAAWRAGGPRAKGVPWLGLLRATGVGLALALASLALYAPFFDRYAAPVGGVGFVPWADGTRVSEYLVLYGLFAAALLPLLAGALGRLVARRGLAPRPALSLGIAAPLASSGPWAAAGLLALLLAVGATVPLLGLRAVLLGLLLLTSVVLLRREVGPVAWFGLLLTWVAWAVSLGVELVFIKDHLVGGDWYRMNTVFKFGLHVWVLLALAAAAGLPALLRGLRRLGGTTAQALGLAALATLVTLTAIYPLFGTPSRVANRMDVNTGPTLDGLAFLDQATFEYDCTAFGNCEPGQERVTVDLRGDGPAIRWLNANISGTPIVVQSNLWFYRAYGIRIAANTGLPTVVSALHVNEQRDPEQAARRDRDVEQFYRTSDVETALRFLARYGVEYVYVGGVERAFYPAAGLAKFEQLQGSYLSRVYDTPEVQIYRVLNIPESYARPEAFDFSTQLPQPVEQQAEPPAAAPAEPPADLAQLEAAQRAEPTSGPLAFGLAERYRALGRLAEAAAVLEPAGRANPSDTGLLHLRGDILSELGRFAEAEEAYLLAAQARPTSGNWNKLGAALLEWGELDKAELALRQAQAVDPQAADPYFQLGRLFAQKRDRDQAVNELRAYLALAPDGPHAGEARRLLAELE